MKKLIFTAAAAAATMAMASGAQAAFTITDPIDFTLDSVDGFSSDTSGAFSADFGFTLTGNFELFVSATAAVPGMTFTDILLDGVSISPTISGGPVPTISKISFPVVVPPAFHTLTFVGSGPANGAFGGSISIAQAVPEPTTWAMMIVGVAAVGMTMRRRSMTTNIAFS